MVKDDPLVKHCLDFIAVVGGEDWGVKGVLPSNVEGTPELSIALSIVYQQIFLNAQDTRIQVRLLDSFCTIPYKH